jgi:outer membrane receptor for ferrienterochelin and colicins
MRFVVRQCALALCAVALFASPLWAQSGTITGQARVADTLAPLGGAVVQVFGADGGRVASSLTNQSGRFVVANVPAGTYSVTVSITGYQTGRVDGINVVGGQSTNISVDLRSQAIDLDPVVVSASRRQERALDAPARVEVVGPRVIAEQPAVQPVEHLRSIAGVDIVSQGLQSTNVVARGFNNVFSGALLALTDHRIAGIPSLRVNALYMVPANNDDIERIEVVLGPGSALYGPNTANGVLHMFTRSPLTYQGTSLSLTGGERSVLHTTMRTSHLIGENLGFKISGQWFQGDEWNYEDPVERDARARALPQNPNTRIGQRDFDTQRWSVDGRMDWRLASDATAIVSLGRSTTVNGIELTGLGASQIRDWSYDYAQARFNWGRLFTQAYVNRSSAGNTFLLRDGAPIVDDSQLFVAQIQHGMTPVRWQNFTYGIDYIRTMPETGGTIHGRYEDDDTFAEAGVFLQSETAVHPKLDVVLAGRFDQHTMIDGTVFSPRAALVFKPLENHTLRASYNRAYSNPGSVNLFLDLNAGPAGALGALGYNIRAQGTGRTGFTFRQADGTYRMRSPFAGTSPEARQQLLEINVANLWAMQVRGIAAALQAQGVFNQQQAGQFVGFMMTQTPAQMNIAGLNPVTQAVSPFAGALDVPGIRESNTTGYEVGYKGILGGRVLLAADVWYSQRDNFISPLIPQTPFVLLDPAQLTAHAQPRVQQFLMAAGLPAEMAAAQAQQIVGGMRQIPGGVVGSPDLQMGPDLLVSYRNFGDINLWGTDLSAMALLGEWTVGASVSTVSDDHFETEGQIITLNAPTRKGNVSLGYRNEGMGFNAEGRVRFLNGFPVLSGAYTAVQCIIPTSAEPCVEAATLADVTLGYRLPMGRRAPTVQLTVQNIFDEGYRSFPGVPAIGRMALLRLRYDF